MTRRRNLWETPSGEAQEERAQPGTSLMAGTGIFYVKLGRGGAWEADSIATGRLRLGWSQQSVEDINGGCWDRIAGQLRVLHRGKPPGVATTDLNSLRTIVESGPEDVWITFHKAKLWWTRLAVGPTEQDDVSKLRRTRQPWSDRAADGRLLVINDLPGKLSQLQGFRGTVCRVRHVDLVKRTLAGVRSPLAAAIRAERAALAEHVAAAIKELHWKDFETLVDLVFRDAGWVRVSVLGQHAKAYDLELREPITGDRYVVQVKSRASAADLEATVASFSAQDYRRVFFVVHSPAADLVSVANVPCHVDIVPPDRLAELTVDCGLVAWLEDRVS